MQPHGYLATYLQAEFAAHCPIGWRCRHEARLLSRDLEDLLGYSPRADVVLETVDNSRRIWIEFEVSRADPVANHAKFATAHLFQPQLSSDTFLAMISPHVDRGRRNLAASTILVMRSIGMKAFQTVLLPKLPPDEIKRLNHLTLSTLARADLSVSEEISRALSVTEPVIVTPEHRIHLAGDILEVMLNIRRWNEEMTTGDGRKAWKRRTVTYFVFDPRTRSFAPSKFCA